MNNAVTMKIKIITIALLFIGALNAAYQDNWNKVNWKQAFQQEPEQRRLDALWQQDKKTIVVLKKSVTDQQILQKVCAALLYNFDRATIEKALDDLKPGNKNILLLKSAEYNLLFIAQYLLTHGTDVNTQGRYGLAPLHWAAIKGHTGVARLLLDYKANINAQTDSGCTPLHQAVLYGKTETVQFLLDNGADTKIRDEIGRTAVAFAGTDELRRLITNHKKAGPAGK